MGLEALDLSDPAKCLPFALSYFLGNDKTRRGTAGQFANISQRTTYLPSNVCRCPCHSLLVDETLLIGKGRELPIGQ